MSEMRVGVAGLGRMGRAIASRLAGRGFPVSGWNRSGMDPEVADGLGIALCVDLAELAAADVIVLSLFDDAAVATIVRGLCAADLRGRLLVDTSTVGPETLRAEHDAIARAGGSAIDAPIAGGPEMVLSGAAGLYIGGAPPDVARFMPLAEALSRRILVMGGPGSGAAAKAVNNMMILGYWQILKEALQVGRAAGLSLEAMLDLLAGSPAASGAFVQRLPVIGGQSDAVGFTVDGAVKDAALFAGLAAAPWGRGPGARRRARQPGPARPERAGCRGRRHHGPGRRRGVTQPRFRQGYRRQARRATPPPALRSPGTRAAGTQAASDR